LLSAGATGAAHAAGAPAAPTPQRLAALAAAFRTDTAEATAALHRVDVALAQEGILAEQLDAATAAVEQAQAGVDAQLRSIYEAGAPSAWTTLLGQDSPLELESGQLADSRVVGIDAGLVSAVSAAQSRLSRLAARAAGPRARVLAAARAVFASQTRARQVLDAQELVYADDQAVLDQLDAERAVLDAQAQLAALASQVGASPADAATATAQAPLLTLLENTPSGRLPAGWVATGQVLQGVASWYGPGFVGHPTSSGAPYDPEAYTCAMLDVPLGSVVHVQGPTGASVNLLVNDHGPYVGGRLIDLSEAAATALGIGLAPVTVTVLVPTGP
jgi:rare lipoprotein A (peptidoglycan hydrolase)